MAGVMTNGPTPWWQTTLGKNDALGNLQRSAPDGYEYDPVKMSYTRTPTAAGQRGNDYFNALTGGSGLPGSLGALNGGDGGGGGGSVFASASSSGPGGTGSVPRPQAPDMTASNAATFARAKDQAGQIARASLNALNGELGAQGMMGGGAQVQGSRDIITDGMGMVGNVSRENAIQDASMKADFAKLGYQGDVTMRGQDISDKHATAQLKLAEQDRYMKMLSLLMQSVSGTNSQLLY
jgi:hypothetical protein